MDFTAINMCLWSVSGQQMSEKSALPFFFNSWKYALFDVTEVSATSFSSAILVIVS